MKKIYSTAMAVMFSASAFAQLNMGVATSNWSGTNSLYLNPANIAGSRHKLVIDVFSVIGGLDNSLGTLNTNRGFFDAINHGEMQSIFNFSSNQTFSMLAPYGEVRGPGILYNFHKNHSIALTTRVRGIEQLNNFDQTLYHRITDPNFTPEGSADITSQNFNYTAHMWSEIDLTYGGVIYDHGNGRLKGGASLRYLGGIGYYGVKGSLDVHSSAAKDSFYAANSEIEYASSVQSAESALVNGISKNSIFHEFFGPKAGIGIGADLGLVYEFTPVDNILGSRGDYKFRLSASVIDIGSINYEHQDNYNAIITGNGYLTGQGLRDNVKSFEDFKNYTTKQGFSVDTARRDTRVYLPTRLIAGVDYKITGHYYVNATFIGNLANREHFGNSFYNQWIITPRYDSRVFSLGVPVSFNTLTSTFRAGVGVRFTGFFIGSDDVLALFARGQYGFNLYAGGFVPIAAHKMKDSDGDGVPDKLDCCPDIPGCPENDGCPADMRPDDNMEHGHETDTADNCPDLLDYMLPAMQVITDSDGDGIADSEDACPSVAGLAENHGCPGPAVAPKETANFSVTTIQMPAGSTAVGKEARAMLDRLAKVMSEYPTKTITIEGYTDNRGSASGNTALSLARATSIKDYLAAKGIDIARMAVKGLGSTDPVADNNTAEGRAKNRRTVIRINK
jgi:outer membrane protein OmpA-like peptidoglycan-associated protein